MKEDSRIVYNSFELMQMMERAVDELRPYRFDARNSALLGQAFLERIGKWEDVIRRQKDLPLTIVVCGEFKRGKSSLINALLGEDVVTTNVTTETVTTNRISYGAHSNELILPGGKRMLLEDEEMHRNKLKGILESLPEKATGMELHRPLEILKDIVIIDTPGLGDAMQDFSQDVADVLNQADAVIYMFSVLSPLSVQEQLFIKTFIKPQKYTELFLIGNYADALESEDAYRRMGGMLADRISELLPGESPVLLSALDERCRQLGEQRPEAALSKLLEDAFCRFRSQLNGLLREKRDFIIPDRVQRLIVGMTDELGADLSLMKSALDMSAQEMVARMENQKHKKAELIKEQEEAASRIDRLHVMVSGHIVDWLDELLAKMEDDIDQLSACAAEDIKKYYELYCIDTLSDAMERCSDVYLTAIYDELSEISGEAAKKLTVNCVVDPAKFRFHLQNKTWTSGDTVAAAGDYVLGGTIFSLATDLLGGILRDKKIETSGQDLIGSIRQSYPRLKVSVSNAIFEMCNNITVQAKKESMAYFEQLLEEADRRLAQEAAVVRQDDWQKEELRSLIAEVEEKLSNIRGRFDYFDSTEVE